jgi:dihydroorotate dehydrogenase
LRRSFQGSADSLGVQAFGLAFPNPVGLAAGFDKDGRAMHGLAGLGFGHLELGTVTPEPQPGNPRPRVFRLVRDRALINRMGFPNAGAEALRLRLKRSRPHGVVLGVNIGKGLSTPLEAAVDDYRRLLHSFYDLADYLAINISSPNTPGLRRLQARDDLEGLLKALSSARNERVANEGRRVPILVKLAPDLDRQGLEDAAGAIAASGMDGVIAGNTTLQREGLRSSKAAEAGGLSGAPLEQRATAMVQNLYALLGERMPIVGVGGILDADGARRKLDAGAKLVQLYTGLVYAGPGLPKRILKSLAAG